MKVVHIVGGRLGDGAARGALTLSHALRRLGLDSRLICADPGAIRWPDGVLTVAGSLPGRFGTLCRAKIDSLPMRAFTTRRRGVFSLGLSGLDFRRLAPVREADIVHLHWINRGMLSIEGLGRIGRPAVWTLRDMWPFTGGCHYDLGCGRYREACGRCPALGSRSERDLSSWVLRRKQAHLPEDMIFVGISDWISDCARQSKLLAGRDIRTVANAIDIARFRPMPKLEARNLLGLPADRPILLHGAINLADLYKGSALLEQAKRRLDLPGLFVCSFGTVPRGHDIAADRHFGRIRDDARLRALYAAADVLAVPSVQEAFGKVPAEAMACGTPVVAFDAAGPGEIVTHRVTGYAARPFDPDDLAAGIAWVLEDGSRLEAMSRAAALDSRRRFDPELCAQRYVDIYEDALSVRHKRSGRGG